MDIVKVIVVDDSAFMRKIISDMIETRNNYKVIAKFKNGQELIDNIQKYDPDIVTLDIEMPVLDGKETLKKLKYMNKKYPIIMLSSKASKDSIHTLECLECGAIDFIQKPGTMSCDINEIKDELLSKIEATMKEKEHRKNKYKKNDTGLCVCNSNNYTMAKSDISVNNYNIKNKQIDAVVIGASTGGPRALQSVLPNIDGDVGIPIFVVQHMPKGFTKTFADRMDKMCSLKVVEASDNMPIEKNTIYVAPGGHHMKIRDKDTIILSDEPLIWGVRPAVDKLFESAVSVYAPNLLSVVLTGMGRDGAQGTSLIKDNGGITISEDESTCTIYGMPRAAYETGKVDMVLKLNEIGPKISEIIKER